MKARRIKGLDPDASLADNAERIVAVRLDELCGFMPKVRDPREQQALHDMRIAAKRLRYVLESTSSCFGPYARKAAKRAKHLQTLLGEIHDCDEQRPAIEELIAQLRAEDVVAVRSAVAAAGGHEVGGGEVAAAPHGAAYDGLVALATALDVRRDLLFDRFLDRWRDLEREGFRARLTYAIAERPEPEPEPEPASDPAPEPASPPDEAADLARSLPGTAGPDTAEDVSSAPGSPAPATSSVSPIPPAASQPTS